MLLIVDSTSGHCFCWSYPCSFKSRRECRNNCDHQPQCNGIDNSGPLKRNCSGLAGNIKRFNGCSNQTNCSFRQEAPQNCTQNAATKSKESSFSQKCKQDAVSGSSQCAQNSDFSPTSDHRDRDGVVDQEGTHHKSDITQNQQIPSEGLQHALVFPRSCTV